MNGHFSAPSKGDRGDGGKQVIRRARQCKEEERRDPRDDPEG